MYRAICEVRQIPPTWLAVTGSKCKKVALQGPPATLINHGNRLDSLHL